MKFYYKKKLMELQRSVYSDNRIALSVKEIEQDGIKFILTVSMPDLEIPKESIPIKTWGDNKDITEVVFNTGLFNDTGKRAQGEVDGKTVQVEFWEFRVPNPFQYIPVIT